MTTENLYPLFPNRRLVSLQERRLHEIAQRLEEVKAAVAALAAETQLLSSEAEALSWQEAPR